MHTLRLTPKGRALLAQAQRVSGERERRVTVCWTERERAQVVALLQRLYEQD
jgi:DNA-binding MarR family transcriptional regulator